MEKEGFVNSTANLGIKLTFLSVIAFFLIIALLSIDSLIAERKQAQDDVTRAVAESTSSAQKIIGPMVIIPYQYVVKENIYAKDNEGNDIPDRIIREQNKVVKDSVVVLPKELSVSGTTDVKALKRGIYQAQVFDSDLKFSGVMNGVDLTNLTRLNDFSMGEPTAVVMVKDSRGIRVISEIKFGNKSYGFKPGNGVGSDAGGIHADLPAIWDNILQETQFEFRIVLQGTESLQVVPTGENTSFALKSNWADPSFNGAFSPSERKVDQNGFSALWQSTWFANRMNEKLQRGALSEFDNLDGFSVKFIKTVDQYQQNTRSVKYGVLFIALTFVTFFIFEIMKSLRVHPVQYLMIGGALVLFFVLLLALSEQLGFNIAYLIAALMCIALITIYSVYTLKSGKSAAIIGILLSALYGVLYAILQAEDLALLAGSLLLFFVLAVVMFVTRKVNWYQLGTKQTQRMPRKEH